MCVCARRVLRLDWLRLIHGAPQQAQVYQHARCPNVQGGESAPTTRKNWPPTTGKGAPLRGPQCARQLGPRRVQYGRPGSAASSKAKGPGNALPHPLPYRTRRQSNLVMHRAKDRTAHALATYKLVSGVGAHRRYSYPVHANCKSKAHTIQSR